MEKPHYSGNNKMPVILVVMETRNLHHSGVFIDTCLERYNYTFSMIPLTIMALMLPNLIARFGKNLLEQKLRAGSSFE